jgi:hypothetical protein
LFSLVYFLTQEVMFAEKHHFRRPKAAHSALGSQNL